MKLTKKPIQNSVSEARYQAANLAMEMRHAEENEDVYSGSGRSEVMPSDLERRHAEERSILRRDRDELSIMEWVRVYGGAVTCPNPDN